MSTTPRIIKEKETFRTEAIINIDGNDVKLYTKATVNYERLTYKVQPVVTLVHGDDIDDAIVESVSQARTECKNRLAQYREEAGIGTQGDLFAGEPASGN